MTVERKIRQVTRAARAMDAALWSVCALVAYFSAGNVFGFAIAHDTPWYVALVLAPIVDVALFAVIMGDSILGRVGVVLDSRWPKGLRLFAGGSTWVLNVWQSTGWFEPRPMDVAGVVLHSIPPVVLIFLAESTPAYRVAFAEALDRLRPAPVVEVVRSSSAVMPVWSEQTAPADRTTVEPVQETKAVQPPAQETISTSDRSAAGSVEELLPVAREIADELAAAGRNISRRSLADGVRARGFTCSTSRAMALLAALESNRPASADQGRELVGALSGTAAGGVR